MQWLLRPKRNNYWSRKLQLTLKEPEGLLQSKQNKTKKHTILTNTHLDEDPQTFGKPRKVLGETICTIPKVNGQLWFRPLKRTKTMDLLGKSQHVTQVRAGRGSFVVPIGSPKKIFNWSSVESCPRRGYSSHFMGRNSHKASDELWVTCSGVSLPDRWLYPPRYGIYLELVISLTKLVW